MPIKMGAFFIAHQTSFKTWNDPFAQRMMSDEGYINFNYDFNTHGIAANMN